MAKQPIPKKSSTSNISDEDVRSMFNRINQREQMNEAYRRYKATESSDSSVISSKDQSNPGSTSTGFSYKLKKD